MDKIVIPASITLENSISIKKYKWKANNKKESIYKIPYKRAAIRFTSKNFAKKINKINKEKRQVLIKFLDNSNVLLIKTDHKGVSLQGYSGKHPYIQVIINKALPKEIWDDFDRANKKTLTIPIKVTMDLDEWKEIKITPADFILEIEKEAKSLMNKALKNGFRINFISKGRDYDLNLISKNKKEIIIAISSHIARTKSRSKEKTIQKILMDIAKMLTYLDENKDAIPVIITRPIEFDGSWSFTTKKYLEFYSKKYNFRFLTTEFKNKWEDNIIKELSKI